MFSPSQSDYTRRRLEKMGVTVHLNTAVRDLGEGWVRAGERRIDSVITIWAAGVEGSPVARTLSGVSLDRAGRVQVAPDLSLPAHPNVFVAGDLATLTDACGVRVPGVAPAAAQMGRHAARQILADLAGPLRASANVVPLFIATKAPCPPSGAAPLSRKSDASAGAAGPHGLRG